MAEVFLYFLIILFFCWVVVKVNSSVKEKEYREREVGAAKEEELSTSSSSIIQIALLENSMVANRIETAGQ